MTIGDRIKAQREALNLTQAELAKRLGYKSRSSINKIELGDNELTQKKIKAIAIALQTTPAYIMGWENIDTETLSQEVKLQEQIQSQYGHQVLNLVNDYRKLDDVDQGKIDERIDILLDQEKYSVKKEYKNA